MNPRLLERLEKTLPLKHKFFHPPSMRASYRVLPMSFLRDWGELKQALALLTKVIIHGADV
jgi:hypothetical protein